MPFANQYGFVKAPSLSDRQVARTIAHELGHGAFGLKHTFDPEYGVSDNPQITRALNLMGYNDQAHLAKFQWDIIHQHSGETEFESSEEVMEVKFGQLGTLQQIMDEMRDAGYGVDIEDMLKDWIKHFAQNRLFTRDSEGNLIDAPGSVNVKRYLYTEKHGWIDMEHFFSFANYTRKYNIIAASIWAFASEDIQSTKINFMGWVWNRSTSAYSYEDIASDFAGIEFWMKYGKKIENEEIRLIDAVQQYLEGLLPKKPKEAPNYEYIPHLIDESGLYTPRNMGDGWTGNKLKEEHKKVYDKLPEDIKAKIKEAHETITD
jgi:hypothetical protein